MFSILLTVATIFIPFGDQIHAKCHTDRTRRMEFLVNGKSKYGYDVASGAPKTISAW